MTNIISRPAYTESISPFPARITSLSAHLLRKPRAEIHRTKVSNMASSMKLNGAFGGDTLFGSKSCLYVCKWTQSAPTLAGAGSRHWEKA